MKDDAIFILEILHSLTKRPVNMRFMCATIESMINEIMRLRKEAELFKRKK